MTNTKTKKKLYRRLSGYAKPPVVMPPAPAEAKARKLPLPGPGIVVKVPLMLLPAWLKLHGLVPSSIPNTDPVGSREIVLRVERTSRTKEGNL